MTLADEIPITTDSRIKTLVYNANEIYQLKFHYGYQSYIEFSEKESIETTSDDITPCQRPTNRVLQCNKN